MSEKKRMLYEVFVSYSSEDQEKVNRIISRLKSQGIERIWYAPSNIEAGKQFTRKIEEGLNNSQVVVVMLSNSSANSFWVTKEWESRLVQMSKDENLKLIPVLLSNCQMPTILNNLHFIDFSKTNVNDTHKFEEKSQELVNSIKGFLPPSAIEVIGIPIAVIAMIRSEAEELLSLEAFNDPIANENQRRSYARFFDTLKCHQLENFVEKYGETRENYCPFESDTLTIRSIIKKIADIVNGMPKRKSKPMIIPQYYSNDFFSNSTDIRERTWEYLEHRGCILIIDSISMFHPKIQSAFLESHLGIHPPVTVACISPINTHDLDLNKILEEEMKKKIKRIFSRYCVGLDPQCIFEIGNVPSINRWLFDTFPKTLETIQGKEPLPSNMEFFINKMGGQESGVSSIIFSEEKRS